MFDERCRLYLGKVANGYTGTRGNTQDIYITHLRNRTPLRTRSWYPETAGPSIIPRVAVQGIRGFQLLFFLCSINCCCPLPTKIISVAAVFLLRLLKDTHHQKGESVLSWASQWISIPLRALAGSHCCDSTVRMSWTLAWFGINISEIFNICLWRECTKEQCTGGGESQYTQGNGTERRSPKSDWLICLQLTPALL